MERRNYNQLVIEGESMMNDMQTEDHIILHIPHASTYVPTSAKFLLGDSDVLKEILRLTDHATDMIFEHFKTRSITFPYNRVYCDVERFIGDAEPMEKYGRGFYYTKTDDGIELRDGSDKDAVLKTYKLHHSNLKAEVVDSLKTNKKVIIIDCHSFSDKPFNTDLIKDANRPDICIGVDDYHTTIDLVEQTVNHFENAGFTVEVNNPYKGTIIPLDYYQSDSRVQGIMIEVNRKLYMDETETHVINDKVKALNNEFQQLLSMNDVYGR
jgi:N-formylglutamate amidohydrolase